MDKACLMCGTVFQVKPSHYHKRFTCSKSCTAERYKTALRGESNPNYRGGVSKVTRSCKVCGSEFTAASYAKGIFCSVKCHNVHQRRFYSEKAEKNRIRNRKFYNLIRQFVLFLDDFSCVKCGQRFGKLHIDHIRPFSYFPEERFKISNLRTLCESCHKKTPTYCKRKLPDGFQYDPPVFERKQTRFRAMGIDNTFSYSPKKSFIISQHYKPD